MKSGFVCIVGRPNVGKSTLMNNIIGEKIAIVSDKPQTTRTRIQGIHTCDRGQVIFVDTPGMHKPKHRLGEYMMKVWARSIKEVDIIYYMIDVSRPFGKGEQYIIEQLKELNTPIFLLVNKIDLIKQEVLNEHITPFLNQIQFSEIIPISAVNGTNLDLLINKTFAQMPEGPLYYPEEDISDQPMTFLISELIREKALTLTRDEVPHSLAVEIEEFRENREKHYVRAVIYIERESQKGIIIGKSGQMLKKIGEQSRLDIEKLLDTKVFLDLWVKVKKNWRDSENNLQQLGYRI